MSKPELAGKHTKGPIRWQTDPKQDCGSYIYALRLEQAERPNSAVIRLEDTYEGYPDCGEKLRMEIKRSDAELLRAAYNSYDKHCGSRAVELAEEDLLGQALTLLTIIHMQICSPDYSGGISTGSSRHLNELLSKLPPKEGQ